MARFGFDRVVICGIGLIGSSLARALRRAHQAGGAAGAGVIVGIDRDAAGLARAIELGVIDEAVSLEAAPSSGFSAPNVSPAATAAVASADVVVLAAPVAQTEALLAAFAPSLAADVLITDVGSTKAAVAAAALRVLGARADRFVAGHPIAGGEASGVDAGRATLFDGRDVILCPSTQTAADAAARAQALWQAVGARPAIMTPEQHDRIFASVSHLPHLLAFAFIEHILKSDGADERFAFAGSGFRDFTRIAASNPEMWRDICLANRDALLDDLDHYVAVLSTLRAAVADGDAQALDAMFARSREAREDWRQGETLAERLDRHG